ncbi:MAG TPA: hypothetical protein VN982_01635 [Candidatus Dormibacteraeota bacterium]|nr:hypothetical protein [Candidatus Dormibacteraeota bacterium]
MGGITPPNLDAALKMCLHSVKWLPGCEHPIIRREMADKAELERKRKRDAEVKAFIGTDQRKVKTEFDRAEAKTVDASKNAETEKIRRLQAEQSESKEEFERLANTYTVNRGGRVDYATTKNRRQALRETKTIIKNGVVRYDLMLDVAKQMVDKFEGSRQNITF